MAEGSRPHSQQCHYMHHAMTALGGGDYDGDDVSVTDNASLVTFLEETTAAVAACICTSIPKGLRLEPPKDHQKQPWQT